MRILFLLLFLVPVAAQEWREALARTKFPASSFQAYQTEPVKLILDSFKPAGEMRGVILMPAASDELYFFNWGRVELPQGASLLDALNALTNQARLTYSFVPPFLLIHHARDVTSDPLTLGADVPAKFHQRKKKGRVAYLDRPYNLILRALDKVTGLKSVPDNRSPASWHYYRLSFVIHDPTAPEYLRAMAYGTKTTVEVTKKQAVFRERK